MEPIARKFGKSQPAGRLEDRRFLTGRGCFLADIAHAGALHAAFLRSPYAHATFTFASLNAARTAEGVHMVLTADDVSGLGALPCVLPIPNADGSQTEPRATPLLCPGRASFVGDVIAMAVAETAEQASAALERIEIDWAELPVVCDMDAALAEDAPAVFPAARGNLAFDTFFGDIQATDTAFAQAAHRVAIRVVNNRVIASYMETCGALADWQGEGCTLHVTSQGVHGFRNVLADHVFGIPRDRLKVVTVDVGGGFGTKNIIHREYALVIEASRRLGRPVRWVADRSEHHLSDVQGRDNLTRAELAMDVEGTILGLRLDVLGNLGAYASHTGPAVSWVGASMATGPYDVPAVHARVRGVYTHTCPTDAYRGAGCPEATYVLERLIDCAARQTGFDPAELRRRNFVRADQMPYRTGTGRCYDVGDFGATFDQALALAEREGFAVREAESRKQGLLRGFGMASYVECTAFGPGETGSLRLDEDGGFSIYVGTQSSGQGHETAFAQAAARRLEIPIERIHVVQGDTSRVASGEGTGGSRSIPIVAVMTDRASEKLLALMCNFAGRIFGVAPEAVGFSDGAFFVTETNRFLSFEDIARHRDLAEEDRIAHASYTPDDATYPNGTHCCEVTIDPETGKVRIETYSVVDDFGVTLNPSMLHGQIHGGVAQGLGQALMEHVAHDAQGQLLSGSLMDYAVPRAVDLPFLTIQTRNIPSRTNPMGLKGAGEAGSVCAPPAVMNAILDALWRHNGTLHIDMPATAPRVFAALRQSPSAPA